MRVHDIRAVAVLFYYYYRPGNYSHESSREHRKLYMRARSWGALTQTESRINAVCA